MDQAKVMALDEEIEVLFLKGPQSSFHKAKWVFSPTHVFLVPKQSGKWRPSPPFGHTGSDFNADNMKSEYADV